MNKIVYNIPRYVAKDGKLPQNGSFFSPKIDEEFVKNAIWISISEPDDQRTIISSVFDHLPTLKLAFYDLKEPDTYKGETLNLPSLKDAGKIVRFLLKHTDKSVIVNCAAGVSRSGAIAQFCNDFLGYEWEPFCKKNADPNHVLYDLMVEYFNLHKNYVKTRG